MKPFELSEFGRNLNNRFPSLDDLERVFSDCPRLEQFGVCRAWIAEGIPSAFSENPLLFEVIREFIGKNLDVHPRDITLVGSARTGFSLSPFKLGKNFDENSDLDLAIVSAEHFDLCEAEFIRFKQDYENGVVVPSGPRQRLLWEEIIEDLERQRVRRGFVDIFKVPTKFQYPLACSAVDTCWRVKEKLNATGFGPYIKECSIRVFRDNFSLIRQNTINLERALHNKEAKNSSTENI